MYLPSARRNDLTVRELADETLVYDHRTNKAHCLNRTTSYIWHQCDGATTVDDLVARVRGKLALHQPEPVVQLALEQLSRRDLLQQPVPPAAAPARLARRAMLKKLAAAASLPLAFSVAAGAARADGQSSATSCGALCNYDATGKLRNTITTGCAPTSLCQAVCPSTGYANGSAIIQGKCT